MTLAIIQARFNSSRLPGKVLRTIWKETILNQVYKRVKLSGIEDIVIATSTNPENDKIESECNKIGAVCFRAPYENDVLHRFYACALKHIKTDPIVRITADCPLIDPFVINLSLQDFKDGGYDYVTTTGGFPDGFDVEVFPLHILQRMWHEANELGDREHVCTYILKNENKFRIHRIGFVSGVPKLSIDTEDDLNRVRMLYQIYGENINLKQVIEHFKHG